MENVVQAASRHPEDSSGSARAVQPRTINGFADCFHRWGTVIDQAGYGLLVLKGFDVYSNSPPQAGCTIEARGASKKHLFLWTSVHKVYSMPDPELWVWAWL